MSSLRSIPDNPSSFPGGFAFRSTPPPLVRLHPRSLLSCVPPQLPSGVHRHVPLPARDSVPTPVASRAISAHQGVVRSGPSSDLAVVPERVDDKYEVHQTQNYLARDPDPRASLRPSGERRVCLASACVPDERHNRNDEGEHRPRELDAG